MLDDVPTPEVHRKTIQHYNIPGHSHELTWSCRDRRPLLIDDAVRAIVGKWLTHACDKHGFGIIAFVFMPEHVHLIVHSSSEAYDISRLLHSIKQPASLDIRRWMESSNDHRIDELMTHRHGRSVFQFWQQGPGFDRNATNGDTLSTMIRYVHNNPVKRGLCREPDCWMWSSAQQYAAHGRRKHVELVGGVPRVTLFY